MTSQRVRVVLVSLVLIAGLSCRKTPVAAVGAGPLAPEVEQPATVPMPDAGPSAAAGPAETEPTAGEWRPVLLASASAVEVAAPPDDRETRQEADELRRLAARRTPEALRGIGWWDAGAVRRWNEIARGLTASEHLNSCQGARLFGLLGVAQYDALVAVWHQKYRFRRPGPGTSEGFRSVPVRRIERFSYPSEDAAVAAASASVLSHLLPKESKFIWRNAESHRDFPIWAGTAYPSDVKAGYEIGLAVGDVVKAWADRDGAGKAHRGQASRESGKWWAERQTLPGWGKVEPWLMKSAGELRAPEPPPLDSPAFQAATREVRAIADARSAEHLLIAQYWDLAVGGISVPGMWDQIGLQAMEQEGFSEPRTARAIALANMAMMDASIACWSTKYHYRVPRPTMRDERIATVMDVPLHPSYPSGHAAFSGAAAAVFGYVLPGKAAWFEKLAQQAAMSRLYGGVHYRFDNDEGLNQGRAAAALAIAKGKSDGCPPAPAAAKQAAATREAR